MSYRLLALVLLSGCDLGLIPYHEFPYVYTGNCLTVISKVELEPDGFEFYENRAQTLMDSAFGAGTFCGLSEKMPPVQVLDQDRIPCGFTQCVGFTDASWQVSLTRQGIALLHEYLHVYELSTARYSTLWHGTWEIKGFNDIDRDFYTPMINGSRLTWIKVTP